MLPGKLPHFVLNLKPEAGLFLLGFLLIWGLERLQVPGGILVGILVTAFLGHWFKLNAFYGIMALPPSIKPSLFQLDLKTLLQPSLVSIVLTFFIVALLDNTATLVGLAHLAGFIDKEGKIPRLAKVFIADSTATMIGSCLGTSTVGSYVESAAGIRAGGRTGLTAIVVALLFLGALFFSPLAKTIPSYATAPALMFVAILMSRSLKHIPWRQVSEWLPSIITALAIPLSFSIAKGVSYGFISYVACKICCLKIRDITLPTLILTLLLIGYLCL
jgi:AGZA family xanthine/uracil permease-like MFS transporter